VLDIFLIIEYDGFFHVRSRR